MKLISLKKIFVFFFPLLFISSVPALAQIDVSISDELDKITDQIKVSYELEKLNECRVKLRAFEFSKLKTPEEKNQYAEAYKLLALGFRNHRYIRPAFDIYQKYISIRDTILSEERSRQLSVLQNRHDSMNVIIMNQISDAQNEKKSLLADKASLDSLKKNNFKYSAIFTLLICAIFIFVLSKYSRKLKEAKNSMHDNRRNMLQMNDEVTKGQMTLGIYNNLKTLVAEISLSAGELNPINANIEKDLKAFKDVETALKTFKENNSKINRLCEISSESITQVLKEIRS